MEMESLLWTKILSVLKRERSLPCSDQMELESHLCSTSWRWILNVLVEVCRSWIPIWTTSMLAAKDSRWECVHSSIQSGMHSVSTRVFLLLEKSKVLVLRILNSRRSSSKRLLTLGPTQIFVPWTSVEVTRESSFVPCPWLLAQR
jgi:hypothetical protein